MNVEYLSFVPRTGCCMSRRRHDPLLAEWQPCLVLCSQAGQAYGEHVQFEPDFCTMYKCKNVEVVGWCSSLRLSTVFCMAVDSFTWCEGHLQNRLNTPVHFPLHGYTAYISTETIKMLSKLSDFRIACEGQSAGWPDILISQDSLEGHL